MSTSSKSGGRTPLGNITNTTDPKERKRQRDRERYALKRDEILKKQREAYHHKKAQAHLKDAEQHQTQTAKNSIQFPGNNRARNASHLISMPEEPIQLRCTPDSIKTVTIDNCATHTPPPNNLTGELTIEQIEAKRVRECARYANLTPEQKQAIRDRRKVSEVLRRSTLSEEQIEASRERRRVHNMTPEEKQAKRDREKARRELRRNTLSQDSIAMQNPKYIPEVVPLTMDASDPHGSRVTNDWSIPPVQPTPVYIQSASDQMPDMKNANQITRRQRVTPGERIALLARHNEHFASRRDKKAYASIEENPTLTVEDTNGLDPPPQSGVVNNENTSLTPQTTNVKAPTTRPPISDDGDDDGVVFDEDFEEEEGYMFAGQDRDTDDEDIEFDEAKDASATTSSITDPYDHVYDNIPQATHMLKPVENCKHCNAKKFEHETNGFCCRNGKIKLCTPETPPELMRLWSSSDADARHFRESIRFFNGHFSFTSLYCNLDGETTDMRKSGIYTFRAHGQMYHNIRSFGIDETEPKHLELYFYDDDPSLEHRYRRCREEQYQQDKELIRKLVDILRDNPYSEQLRSMGQVEDLDDYRVTLNLDHRLDQRTYNIPATSEVAAVWVEGSERRRHFENSVILQGKNKQIYGIRSYHGCYDALSYPLFFPRGELGWHPDIPKVGVSINAVTAARAARMARGNNHEDPDSNGRLCVSVRDYYCYKFQIRPGIFNPILFGKRLFQQFAVDTYIKIESSRLDYIWAHQKELRADLYQGLVDSVHAGEGRADAVGKRTVLATSFIGGPRDKRRRYMDAMALVRKYGKPDVFLTMTCNPNWDEITRELYPSQIPQDRPDLVVRVFRAKLEELKKQLLDKHMLGKVKAYVYVVEFQKRGLPHAHFLLIMKGRYKLTCPEQYDCIISAELPDKRNYPELYKMVVKHMMHGPCGVLNRDCPCTKDRPSCKNHYPRSFNATTLQGKDSYPVYRRRDDGRHAMVRKHELDNRWVVPYNPYLLRLFNCHINVEVCSSIKAVKYLFKYIYKGHDRASVSVNEADRNGNIDEIRQYRDARWVTPPEALWRIYGFDLSKNSPPVMQLQLHLPNMHMVSFQEGQDIQEVLNREDAEKSMLTEYFEANRVHDHARGILYRDFPEWYTWQKGKNKNFWQRRRREGGQVGRIVSAHPAEGERYYLRVLLNHVTGATSFANLRMVDGEILPTFREAAERRGLIEADNTLDECLTEAELFHMPPSLRRLFATILVFCEPSDVRGL
ncbi:uncharacterized protein LOC133900579 isoform X3 [Phragmites australis]|uniref:uncharacterized protein LOC133900579 isoform X3 n=1 Tax=Phragmites australis TaxID=29695 RepID=UPI002D7659AB|nr:uncharacterized protein LOC133900579 isoform X3 [Phragmites australis]XP_062197791.1 uncharacterized protein LOC133900579 isoform X3 [Phragmites australis]